MMAFRPLRRTGPTRPEPKGLVPLESRDLCKTKTKMPSPRESAGIIVVQKIVSAASIFTADIPPGVARSLKNPVNAAKRKLGVKRTACFDGTIPSCSTVRKHGSNGV